MVFLIQPFPFYWLCDVQSYFCLLCLKFGDVSSLLFWNSSCPIAAFLFLNLQEEISEGSWDSWESCIVDRALTPKSLVCQLPVPLYVKYEYSGLSVGSLIVHRSSISVLCMPDLELVSVRTMLAWEQKCISFGQSFYMFSGTRGQVF